MALKTESENRRLFEEARSLRQSVRSSLHEKAKNTPGSNREPTGSLAFGSDGKGEKKGVR